jgi:hypothetical protein
VIKGAIARNDWLKLASGSVVAVCRVETIRGVDQASLRYLDKDGVMATVDFMMRLDHLKKYAEKVEVSPCVI